MLTDRLLMPGYVETCEKAAKAAGAVLLEKLGRVTVREKGPADLVTEADLAAQETVARIVLEAFPDHAVLGEEAGCLTGAAGENPEYRWIVDPLDGTTNYVHQVPFFAVSLALEHQGELLAGTVWNPVSRECFTAAAGEGACLNGKPIRTSGVEQVRQSLAAVGFPTVVDDNSRDLRLFMRTLSQCQALRRTGCCSLNLAFVAAGRFDMAWSFCTHVWDVAAGALLVREAGGLAKSPDGGDYEPSHGSLVVAANERLYAELLRIAGDVLTDAP